MLWLITLLVLCTISTINFLYVLTEPKNKIIPTLIAVFCLLLAVIRLLLVCLN